MDREQSLQDGARLENLGLDLAEHPERHPLFHRRALVVMLARMLEAPRLNPVLVGEAGVGKTSVVKSLALAMKERNDALAPRGLHGRRIILVTSSDLVCGALYANQLEEKLTLIVRNCRNQRAFLFLFEPLGLIGSGATSSNPNGDVATLLSPYIRHGDLRVVAASSPDAWMLASKRSPSFAALFTPVIIPEATTDETRHILRLKSVDWTKRLRMSMPAETQAEAVALAERLFPGRRRPGKLIDMLEGALAAAAAEFGPAASAPPVRQAGPPPTPRPRDLSPEQLADAVRKVTGLPRFLIVPDEPAPTAYLFQTLRDQVRGQDHVLRAMVERIQMIKARLCAPDRPLGAFLFAGPTGVGKTLVARRVAALLLGDERRLIRFDMSEYQEADSVERFAGDPRPLRSRLGLVDAATAEPLPVILLDEIEKAHPRVFDVLLQALGEGRITDARGRTASLTNSLIMMTSNLGSRKAYVDLPRQQGARASWHARVQEAVRRRFRPELVNRLTAILTFSPLGRADILAVAQREIDELLRRRGVRASGLSVVVAPGATEAVLNAGYSEQFGVRPMQRAVDAIIGETLAQLLAAYPDCRNRTLVLDWVSSMGRVCIVPTSQKRAG